jgi:hypothetical protein
MIAVIEGANDGRDFLIIPETFGQYTGAKDRNGRRIFEGDIVKTFLYTDDDNKNVYANCLTKYKATGFGLRYKGGWVYFYQPGGLEVIGNIHDTPELLGREKGLFDEEESENE